MHSYCLRPAFSYIFSHYVSSYDVYYFLGAGFGLAASLSGAGNLLLISGPMSEVPTTVLMLFVGVTGILLPILATSLDANEQILSDNITDISGGAWGALSSMAGCWIVGYYCLLKVSVILQSCKRLFQVKYSCQPGSSNSSNCECEKMCSRAGGSVPVCFCTSVT